MLDTAQPASPTTIPPHLTLDALAQLSSNELEGLYRSARVSSTMRAADGELVGRMLAVRWIGKALAPWAASSSFVWDGKTFAATSDDRGTGHNRVNVPGVLGKQNLFPFETRFGASAIDGAPTLILDYDLDANPAYIRRIHDEIREVTPGLFLGPAMWKAGQQKTLVLWFALDARLS